MQKMFPVIKCCVCGTEYMPSEIFIPKYFFGNQKDISRSPAGKIEFYTGDDMGLEEEFSCNNCGANLKIVADLNFEVTANEEDKTFEEEFVATFNKPKKLKLEEQQLF